jgi:hypothetical protein
MSGRRSAWWWLLALGAVAALAGGLGFGLAVNERAAWSFLGGLALALVVVSAAALMVGFAGRISPALAMVAALSNYALTVLFFVLLLVALGPEVVDVPAFAIGLAASVIPYLGWQFAAARPRP